jgi:hypothetical protein
MPKDIKKNEKEEMLTKIELLLIIYFLNMNYVPYDLFHHIVNIVPDFLMDYVNQILNIYVMMIYMVVFHVIVY